MTDETLIGFLDRELGQAEHADVEARAAREPDIAARLSRLRANDDLLRAAFDAPMHKGLPDRFAAVIDTGLAKAAYVPTERVARLRPSNDNRPRWWHLGTAVAASLTIGLVMGTQFLPDAGGATATPVALSKALSATPSLQTVTLASGERLTPELTVAQSGGGYCRQFRLATVRSEHAGVACRTQGQWAIEALLPASPAASSSDGYVTAEGGQPSGVETVTDARRAGDPLDAAAENALIARGWQ